MRWGVVKDDLWENLRVDKMDANKAVYLAGKKGAMQVVLLVAD